MAANQNETTVQEAQQPLPSVGAILRAEREARGLSVEEIAERVKFSVRQVEALEHDDVEHLPQGTFLRGFVRSYARVLGVDEAMLLAATHTQTEHHFDVADVQAGGAPLPVAGDANRRSRYLMLSALAVAILLAGFVWTHREEASLPAQPQLVAESPLEDAAVVSAVAVADAEPEEVPPASIAPVEVHKPEPVVQPKEIPRPAPVAKQAETPKPVAVAKPVEAAKPPTATKLPEPVKVAPVVKPVEPAKPVEGAKPILPPKPPVAAPQADSKALPATTVVNADEEAASAPKSTVPLSLLMKRPIHIVFNEDAWMEIIDVNGEILLSRVTKAGEEKWIGGGHRAPYNVTIARPGAIRMYYHGKEVDLSKFNPASVAKLVLE